MFALAELAAGLLLGNFLGRERAEAALFLAYRPWLLLVLLLAPGLGGMRTAAAAAGVLIATVAEALLVAGLGAPLPIEAAVRAGAAGLLLVGALAGAVALARLAEPRRWRWLAAALGGGLLLFPGVLALHEGGAVRPVASPGVPTTRLAVLSGLPLRWSEAGALATLTGDGAQAAWRALSANFVVRPIDRLHAASLSGVQLLLVAQPRDPGPAGLVALDDWVRRGGRLLLLTDPALRWPTRFGPGDPRAPPGAGGLAPLLAHWGLRLENGRPGPVVRDLGARRIVLDGAGRFSSSSTCWPIEQGLGAECRIGAGRVRLLADADLLHDRLWAGPGAWGEDRRGRIADNLPLLLDWLDELAGKNPGRDDRILWARVGSGGQGVALATIFAAATLVLGVWLRRR